MGRFKRLASVFAVIAIVLAAVSPTSAQQSATGIQVSPTKHPDISIEPGEVKQVSFVVKNITTIDITARVTLNDFESDGFTGQPKIIIDKNKTSDRSLKKFIRDLQDVDLKSGESKEVKVTIDVPTNTAPGAYYGALRFEAVPKSGRPDEQRQVALTASVAPLLLVQVNGNIKEQIQIQSVKAQKGDKAASFFLTPPDKSAVTIKNLGNSFARPFGRVSLLNMSGKEVGHYELNKVEPRGTVLPESARTFTDSLTKVKTPGRYTISANIAQGNGGEVISFKSSFWYMPAWSIAVLLALVAAVVGAIFYLQKRAAGGIRRHK